MAPCVSATTGSAAPSICARSASAIRPGTLRNERCATWSSAARTRAASSSSMAMAIAGRPTSTRRMSVARIASVRVGSTASTVAERGALPNIAISPSSAGGRSWASAIVRPSECVRVTRTQPEASA